MFEATTLEPDAPPAAEADRMRRFLAPLKRGADGLAALSYVAALADKRACVAFLHVEPTHQPEGSEAAKPGAQVISSAEVLGRQHGVRHESYILQGNTAFAILDTAEMLGCEAIVVRAAAPRGWRRVFSADLRADIADLIRHIPLLQVDDSGNLVRSTHP